jgi:hypothetical protein
MFCKECDEDAPATEWITENGIVVHRQEVEGGVFEAVAATYNDSRRDYLLGATDTTYTCEAEKRSDISEALAWAFTKSDLAVLGYLRLQKNSDERPAVLYCADGGVLVLQTLFYHEDEVQSHTPYFEYTAESEALSNAYLETLTQLDVLYPEALKHRELKEIQKQITKATAEKGVKSVGE